MSTTITGPPRPVMGEDARTRYTEALSARAGACSARPHRPCASPLPLGTQLSVLPALHRLTPHQARAEAVQGRDCPAR